MDIIKSIIWFIISLALISLAFFGLSKFVVWYPTFNSFLFYFLAFWFALGSIRLIPSRICIIQSSIKIVKTLGYSTFQVLKIIIQIILLVVCWVYFVHTILTNTGLYQNWEIIGLISYILFVAISTLSIIGSMLSPGE